MVSRSRLKVLSLGALGLAALSALMLFAMAGPFTSQEISAQGGEELLGTFQLDPGECEEGGPVTSGSYFQMTDGSGNLLTNVSARSSPRCDPTFTPLFPGTQGGLVTNPDFMEDATNGLYQPYPEPACDELTKAGLADRIHAPQGFFGVDFGSATQGDIIPTGGSEQAPPPTIVHDGNGNLSGDLSSYTVCWSALFFAQGDPRLKGLVANQLGQENNCAEPLPRGLPSEPVSGTYDEATGAYTLDWASRIGGSFGCTFTGFWHFEGTFTTEPITLTINVGGLPPAPDKALPILLVTAIGLIAVGGGGLTLAYSRRSRRR